MRTRRSTQKRFFRDLDEIAFVVGADSFAWQDSRSVVVDFYLADNQSAIPYFKLTASRTDRDAEG